MTQGQRRFYTALGYDNLIDQSPFTPGSAQQWALAAGHPGPDGRRNP